MTKILTVLSAVFALQTAQAQPPSDYLTKVCERAASAAALKNYRKSQGAFVSDYHAWDRKKKEYSAKYTGYAEVVIGIEESECYEAYEVKTEVKYPEGAKTPSCKVIKVTYKDRDCA